MKMRCFLILFLFGLSTTFADNVAVEEFANSNNLLFTPAVYKEIAKDQKDNFLVSPLSAETVLALTLSGCKGETAQELRNGLRLPDDNERVESIFKTLLPKITANQKYSLHTANRIYLKKSDLEIRETYRSKAVEIYQSDLEKIDFSKTEEAAKIMNDWVERQTNSKILNLISESDLTEETALVLINALYFKANWTVPFADYKTIKSDFYKSSKDVVKVDTMHQSEELFKYYECPHLNAKFLELPFEGDDASITIILPNVKEGLGALENQIDRVFIPHNLTYTIVNVALPKFKIETSLEFKEILKRLGVQKLFDDEEADLSGIAGKKGSLVVDAVKQKTFINLNEVGVEAAAATAVIVRGDSALVGPPPKEFKADHPFIFYLKIKGVIAFAGRVVTPKL